MKPYGTTPISQILSRFLGQTAVQSPIIVKQELASSGLSIMTKAEVADSFFIKPEIDFVTKNQFRVAFPQSLYVSPKTTEHAKIERLVTQEINYIETLDKISEIRRAMHGLLKKFIDLNKKFDLFSNDPTMTKIYLDILSIVKDMAKKSLEMTQEHQTAVDHFADKEIINNSIQSLEKDLELIFKTTSHMADNLDIIDFTDQKSKKDAFEKIQSLLVILFEIQKFYQSNLFQTQLDEIETILKSYDF